MNQRIVNEARSWIGTRFKHQGRVKKSELSRGGCDCIGLVIGVADNVGILCHGRKISSYDRLDYPKIPCGNMLLEEFHKYLEPISPKNVLPGDILMFRFDKDPQHVAIVGDLDRDLSLIHCYLQARGVVEHRLDDVWKERIVAGFRFSQEMSSL
ncbi:MAG: putative phage cell wall peptidase NlpC/P60 family [Rickettsiaceae bacterium]|jgi:NlpC/P60 family putative phage cell wall peptidase|nr:putative phage cell wall peptidase NlpC/P60 family [Rickettsiaceae bacterium]